MCLSKRRFVLAESHTKDKTTAETCSEMRLPAAKSKAGNKSPFRMPARRKSVVLPNISVGGTMADSERMCSTKRPPCCPMTPGACTIVRWTRTFRATRCVAMRARELRGGYRNGCFVSSHEWQTARMVTDAEGPKADDKALPAERQAAKLRTMASKPLACKARTKRTTKHLAFAIVVAPVRVARHIAAGMRAMRNTVSAHAWVTTPTLLTRGWRLVADKILFNQGNVVVAIRTLGGYGGCRDGASWPCSSYCGVFTPWTVPEDCSCTLPLLGGPGPNNIRQCSLSSA